MPHGSPHGLFIGLTTLDLIYRADQPPTANQKIVALDYTVAAGGPATNAAATFAYLGGQATLLSALGQHAMTQLIRADLTQCGVSLADLAPTQPDSPPVSSIIVSAATGDRAVIGINASRRQATVADIPPEVQRDSFLETVDVVLLDGHQIEVGAAIAQLAKAQGIPTVLDGGSWKPGLEKVLPHIDYAICSANFQPPQPVPVVEYLTHYGIAHIAITHGHQPIQYWSPDHTGEIPIPPIVAIDTLGAGDIFHGAFCYALRQRHFVDALRYAAQVAGRSCQSFGTRNWMQ